MITSDLSHTRRLKIYESMIPLLVALWAFPASPASAQTAAREEFSFIGWNKACSAAVALYGFGETRETAAGKPVATRIGTLTIESGEQRAQAAWIVDWNSPDNWDEAAATKARQTLLGAGYAQPGFAETLRAEPLAPGRRDLAELLLSTGTFRTRAPSGWPKGTAWRLSSVNYSPLATCAILVLATRGAAGELLQPLLIRSDNPAARLDRARGHLANARLLFDNGDAVGALAETEIAATMAPESALARYQHAGLLCLNGYIEEAVAELAAAVRLDPRNKATARKDKDFDSLFEDPRFKELTAP